MNESIESIVARIAAELKKNELSGKSAAASKEYDLSDYPMLDKHRDEIRTPTGKGLTDLTLEKVLDGSVNIKDIRISSDMLHAQAQIAASAGKPQIGENLKRAAEMTQIPDDELIKMYDMLRPNRSTKQQLVELAQKLEQQYQATICAQLVREATEVYERRGILKKAD